MLSIALQTQLPSNTVYDTWNGIPRMTCSSTTTTVLPNGKIVPIWTYSYLYPDQNEAANDMLASLTANNGYNATTNTFLETI